MGKGALTWLVAAPTCQVLAGQAAAGFIGLTVEQLPNDEFGNILTFRIYAQFDGTQGSSGNDFVFVVADCGPAAPLSVFAQGGTFFQHAGNLRADLSPDPTSCLNDATICRDTFVTIGKLTSSGDTTALSPGWPGFGPDTLQAENAGWYINASENPPQATPGLADNPPDRVLLMQLSSTNAVGFCGGMLVGLRSDGVVGFPCVTFTTGCFVDPSGDGVVGITDLLTVIEQWGPCPSGCAGDVTANGTVNIDDFLQVLTNWGPCPSAPGWPCS